MPSVSWPTGASCIFRRSAGWRRWSGAPADVAELLSLSQLPESAEELGSVPVRASRGGQPTEQIRSLLRVPRPDGVALAEALHAAAAVRSARKSGGAVRVMLDPLELF